MTATLTVLFSIQLFLGWLVQHIFLARKEKRKLIFLNREDLDFLCEKYEYRIFHFSTKSREM